MDEKEKDFLLSIIQGYKENDIRIRRAIGVRYTAYNTTGCAVEQFARDAAFGKLTQKKKKK